MLFIPVVDLGFSRSCCQNNVIARSESRQNKENCARTVKRMAFLPEVEVDPRHIDRRNFFQDFCGDENSLISNNITSQKTRKNHRERPETGMSTGALSVAIPL